MTRLTERLYAFTKESLRSANTVRRNMPDPVPVAILGRLGGLKSSGTKTYVSVQNQSKDALIPAS